MKTALRKILAMTLAMGIIFTLASCSPGEKNSSTAKESSAGNTQSGNTESGGNSDKAMSLSLGLPGGYDVTSEEIVTLFKEKYPNITLTIDDSPWGDFGKKITAQIAGGNAPDVWFQENATILGYGERGAALDLAPLIEANLNKDNYADTLFSAQAGEKVWGVPHGINPIGLAYNKTVFDNAGVDYPTNDWTYQDLVDTAEKLTKDGVYGFLAGGSITVGWYPWIRSADGMALDESRENAVFDDEKSMKGITAWADLVKNKISPTISEQNDMGKAPTMFANNKAAMMFVQYSEIAGNFAANFPDLDYDTVMIPKTFDGSGRYVPAVGNTWMINARSSAEAQEAAWLWIEHYLSDEVQEIIAKSGATLPVNKNAFASIDSLPGKPLNKAAFTQGVAEAATTLDENSTWSEWRLAAQPIFEEILNGTKAPADGLKEIKQKVQAVLDEAT